jgi:hypothetical protein
LKQSKVILCTTMDYQKLKTIIEGYSTPLGSTDVGRSWCMRALHPAHPSLAFHGIPDRTAVPTAMLEYRSTYTLAPPSGATTIWGASLCFLPSPILFATTRSTYGSSAVAGTLVNNQIPGTFLSDKLAYWRMSAGQARCAYYGVTIEYDSPTLLDQGTVVCSQLPSQWQILAPASAPSATDLQADWLQGSPTYDSLIHLPLAIQLQGREGLYIPVKLDDPALAFTNQGTALDYQNPLDIAMTALQLPTLLHAEIPVAIFQNMSIQTSLRICVRMGVEAIVPPNSPYSLFSSPSSPPDPVALDSYFSISARLLDAYPACYNDWNQLWGAIKDVARVLLPVVGSVGSLVPGIGQGIGWAANAASAALSRNGRPRSGLQKQARDKAFGVLSRSASGSNAVREGQLEAQARQSRTGGAVPTGAALLRRGQRSRRFRQDAAQLIARRPGGGRRPPQAR